MSQKVSKIEDLTTLTVPKLKGFLKERNIPGNGTKAELLQLARLYFSRPVVRVDASDQGAGQGGPLQSAGSQWKIISNDSKVQVISSCTGMGKFSRLAFGIMLYLLAGRRPKAPDLALYTSFIFLAKFQTN
jgi:hypothetical protein